MDSNRIHISILFLIILMAVNLLILDIKLFSSDTVKVSQISTAVTPDPTIVTQSNNQSAFVCPQSCIDILEKRLTQDPQRIGALEPTLVVYQPPVTRESYIPLGTGLTTRNYWDDLISTETLIDPANYGTIKEAYFIASLKNPTQNGEVKARIYNVTDKHPVWGSEVSLNGPLSQTLTSSRIDIATGPKLYRVQLLSSLSFEAILENARIRIVAY